MSGIPMPDEIKKDEGLSPKAIVAIVVIGLALVAAGICIGYEIWGNQPVQSTSAGSTINTTPAVQPMKSNQVTNTNGTQTQKLIEQLKESGKNVSVLQSGGNQVITRTTKLEVTEHNNTSVKTGNNIKPAPGITVNVEGLETQTTKKTRLNVTEKQEVPLK